MKNILIVTGGSGGHVVPSTTLYEHLKNKFSVNIVSDLRGSKFINSKKFKYELIDVPNLLLNQTFRVSYSPSYVSDTFSPSTIPLKPETVALSCGDEASDP